jgi:iron complex transport system permease protein
LLRNPLAEPGVLGVSASAALAATSALYFGLGAVSAWVVPSAAIAGALGATLFLAAAAARAVSTIGLVLIGVGLSSFAGALMALLLNLAPNPFSLADLVSWVLGSVANRGIGDVALAAPFMALGAVCLLASHRGLVALTLGEDGANAIGANVARTRTLVVIGAGLLTGASVALGGVIGFVGIVAPHLVRGLVVHDAGRVLIPSALLAGALLCAADLIVRLSATQQELKLGAVAALIGAPAFVWIALRARGDA